MLVGVQSDENAPIVHLPKGSLAVSSWLIASRHGPRVRWRELAVSTLDRLHLALRRRPTNCGAVTLLGLLRREAFVIWKTHADVCMYFLEECKEALKKKEPLYDVEIRCLIADRLMYSLIVTRTERLQKMCVQ
jgi:hypothetical protein